LKGQTYVILAIIFVIVISIFAVLNIESVEVNYIFWQGHSPLIFVILFSVLLGALLATAIGSKKYFSLKRENRQLEQRLKQISNNELEEAMKEERNRENKD